jgi:hypothetical protein
MQSAWGEIEDDESMLFIERRHEIGEHKKDHDDTIGRLKTEDPDVAAELAKEYKNDTWRGCQPRPRKPAK